MRLFSILVALSLLASSCERRIRYESLVPSNLPDSFQALENDVTRFPGYNRWRVFLKGASDFESFKNYSQTLGLAPCKSYRFPSGTADSRPAFWNIEDVFADKSAQYYASPVGGLSFKEFHYTIISGVWHNGYFYFYFIAEER